MENEEGGSERGKMLAGLQHVKLRKTEVVHDSSGPKLTGFISEDDVRKYQDDVLDVNMEFWVGLLGETTFRTEFYPIGLDDAQTFIECYEHFEKKQEFPVELQQRLSKIEDGLQKVIEEAKGTDTGVFVKTSSRSAKDTGIFSEKFKDLYRKYLREKKDKDENDKLICLLEAGTQVQKMENAKQVLQMFSISERISQDMKLALAHPDRFTEHFVIRQWVDLDPSLEFRGFVKNNTLNALSQYNHLAFFPHLVADKENIVKSITDHFYDVALPKLKRKFTSYIIDFALVKLDSAHGGYKIWIIELNPFLPTTDGCLFSWEKERNILENGPFEYRYRTSKASGAKAMLANAWRDVLTEVNVD